MLRSSPLFLSFRCSRAARHGAALLAAAIIGALAGCAAPRPPMSPPPAAVPIPAPPAPPAAPADAAPPADTALRPRARWVRAPWAELPGFGDDRLAEVWPALVAGCARPAPGWSELCARALLAAPADDDAARDFLVSWLQPWRLETHEGQTTGLATGYFEPLIEARRRPDGVFRTPLYAAPPELATQRPFFTRRQIDSEPAAQALLRGREIAWVADPLDALVLQIQGSGRLNLTEPDGRQRRVRVAFAGHNDHPYRSVGRWLIERGELRPDGASWPAIKDWARANPGRVDEMLWANPRFVFFREEPLPDPDVGPRGAQGVPLVPGRSIAVDPQAVPYGTPVWIDTTEPLTTTPLRRLVMAQDTGSAIVGAVRVDYFWGWGEVAEAQAGRMKQPVRAWALWPRGAVPPP